MCSKENPFDKFRSKEESVQTSVQTNRGVRARKHSLLSQSLKDQIKDFQKNKRNLQVLRIPQLSIPIAKFEPIAPLKAGRESQ